ncbi:hypothetical protein SUGI_0579080 [Cryptomeria japonica]|nr:hypothetical protein SUGI_0579080 [Cryptomeria japonica]
MCLFLLLLEVLLFLTSAGIDSAPPNLIIVVGSVPHTDDNTAVLTSFIILDGAIRVTEPVKALNECFMAGNFD